MRTLTAGSPIAIPYSFALFAFTPDSRTLPCAVFIPNGDVTRVEVMAANAVGDRKNSVPVDLCRHSARAVLSIVNRLKMVRVYALSIATKMIQLHSFRNRPLKHFIDDPMGQKRKTVFHDSSIAKRQASRPVPASCFIHMDLRENTLGQTFSFKHLFPTERGY